MKAPRSWLSSYSIIQTSASILSLSPLHTPCARTHTHTLPEFKSAWLCRPLPPPPPGQRHQDIDRHTTLISDLQAGAPFKVKGTGTDETKMDTAAAMLQTATGDTKVTQPIPVYSYSSRSYQIHGLTLALCCISTLYIKSWNWKYLWGDDKCTVFTRIECKNNHWGKWMDEAHWGISVLVEECRMRTQRWAQVTAANCHSTFALLVLICLLLYWQQANSSLTAGVAVEHLRPGSIPGQSLLLLPGPRGPSFNVCSEGAWEEQPLLSHCWKLLRDHKVRSSCHDPWLPGFKHKHACLFINLHVL